MVYTPVETFLVFHSPICLRPLCGFCRLAAYNFLRILPTQCFTSVHIFSNRHVSADIKNHTRDRPLQQIKSTIKLESHSAASPLAPYSSNFPYITGFRTGPVFKPRMMLPRDAIGDLWTGVPPGRQKEHIAGRFNTGDQTFIVSTGSRQTVSVVPPASGGFADHASVAFQDHACLPGSSFGLVFHHLFGNFVSPGNHPADTTYPKERREAWLGSSIQLRQWHVKGFFQASTLFWISILRGGFLLTCHNHPNPLTLQLFSL